MSLFRDPVDRYFIGKLLAGLLFILSLAEVLHHLIGLSGLLPAGSPASESSSIGAAAVYALGCLLWFGAFRFVEHRRNPG